MPKDNLPNLARLIYEAYPDSDLLPIDPQWDCRSLDDLLERVTTQDLGDSLLEFLVTEIVEGGEGTLEGAIRVLTRARKDVDAVLQALFRARADHLEESPRAAHRARAPTPPTWASGGVPIAAASFTDPIRRSPRPVRRPVPPVAARCGWPEVLPFPLHVP